MPEGPQQFPDSRLLPGAAGATEPVRAIAPVRQMQDMPKEELEALAEEYGLDPSIYRTRQHLVAAVHERRQLIAGLDREAMLDVVRWGRRPIAANATKEQMALEIARIKTMNFGGLSRRGLVVLAQLRGVSVNPADEPPTLIRKLKRSEGFLARINRKRRALIGSVVSNLLGEAGDSSDYQFLPPQSGGDATRAAPPPPPRPASIKEEIEESGLLGGLAGRIKRSADSYVNQKLDEIEARIDRKLDEIDRRLGEWRDKEIANRIRILKITLWASVIVAVISLLYSYVKLLVEQLGR